MFHTFSTKNFYRICDKLAASDKDLAAIIAKHGYSPMWTRPNTYETLVHIILEQQVSLASALAALKKLQEHTKGISPAKILTLTDEEMRACYVSRQKAMYIRGLAEAIKEEKIKLQDFGQMSNDEARAQLITLKGIGNWTIDVYLMFVLQRADIFPMGDLAAVNALKKVKHLAKDIPREQLSKITEQWKPYRTVATMLLWHDYLSSPFKSKQ